MRKTVNIKDDITLEILSDDRFKTNYISIGFLVPLSADTASLYSLIPKVLCRGCREYPDTVTLNRHFDDLYSSSVTPTLHKYGEVQEIGLSSRFLDNSYVPDGTDLMDKVLSMLKSILFDPFTENNGFSTLFTETEKANQIDRINSQINSKTYYALNRCNEEMCKNEVFGVTAWGTAEATAAITPKSLYDAYRKVLKSSVIRIFFCGRCDEKKLIDFIGDMFSYERDKSPALNTEIILRANEVKNITEEQPVTQGKLTMGFRCGISLRDEKYYLFSLFSELFGSSPTSRLFMNVREKLSLCYYCSSIPKPHKGIMFVASGIENENFERAKEEILRQLDIIRRGEFTERELDFAKSSLVNSYRSMTDSPESVESWYTGRFLTGRTDTPDDAANAVMGATADEISEIAKGITLDTVFFLRGTAKA